MPHILLYKQTVITYYKTAKGGKNIIMTNTLVAFSVADNIRFIVVSILVVFIDIIQIAMFVRAILSWVGIGRNSKILFYLYFVTEPIIMPVRKLFKKMNWFGRLPIDISFLVTYILLSIISAILTSYVI